MSIEGTQVIAIAGWIGYIFPKVILLYAPLALFLGILVQLIWEEKTVTQPL
jgi:lipopolysaccharide export LptBFGC system permease protein LptF